MLYDFKYIIFNIYYMLNIWVDYIFFFGEENIENGLSDLIVLYFNLKIS